MLLAVILTILILSHLIIPENLLYEPVKVAMLQVLIAANIISMFSGIIKHIFYMEWSQELIKEILEELFARPYLRPHTLEDHKASTEISSFLTRFELRCKSWFKIKKHQ